MNTNKVAVLSELSIFNPDNVNPIPKLSIEYTVYLNSLLISNWVEILNEKYYVMTLLNDKDKEFIPQKLFPDNFQIVFHNGFQTENVIETVLKGSSENNSKVLLLFFNTIGLRDKDIQRCFNLVNQEEASIVVAKSKNHKLILNCSMTSEKKIIESFIKADRDFNSYMNLVGDKDIFIHALDSFLSIDDFDDIKKLYIELSKKESHAYCSQKMHESFNDLFIEYKDLLNV